jgi:tetratricopeptide (TPR) repeat protein
MTMRRVYSIVLILILLLWAPSALCTVAETEPALRAFRAGRFDELEERLATLIAMRRGEHRELDLYFEAMGRAVKAIELDPSLNANLEAWQKAVPDSAHSYYLMASIEMERAWKARGRGYANTVADDAWPEFHAHMDAADEILTKARKIDPRNLPIAVGHIDVATYGSGDVKRIVSRFEEALAIDPASEAAHRAMTSSLGAKWQGSDELVLRFVRDAARRHPDAPALDALLVDVHVEIAFRRRRTSDDVSRYFSQPEVWEEVFPAAERYAAAHPGDAWAHNNLAWLAWRGGRPDIAKRAFAILDGNFDDDAWDDDMTPEQALAWAEASEP